MGDRTNVTITVRKKDYERLMAVEGESEANFREAIPCDGAFRFGDSAVEWG